MLWQVPAPLKKGKCCPTELAMQAVSTRTLTSLILPTGGCPYNQLTSSIGNALFGFEKKLRFHNPQLSQTSTKPIDNQIFPQNPSEQYPRQKNPQINPQAATWMICNANTYNANTWNASILVLSWFILYWLINSSLIFGLIWSNFGTLGGDLVGYPSRRHHWQPSKVGSAADTWREGFNFQ